VRDAGPSRGHGAPDALSGAPTPSTAESVLRDWDAEVKRMFVVAAQRDRGHARAVLAELERSAAAAGRRRAVLETGTRKPEGDCALHQRGVRADCHVRGIPRFAELPLLREGFRRTPDNN
jgi:GNAT superfamily N-acetyltransferase